MTSRKQEPGGALEGSLFSHLSQLDGVHDELRRRLQRKSKTLPGASLPCVSVPGKYC